MDNTQFMFLNIDYIILAYIILTNHASKYKNEKIYFLIILVIQ